MGLALFLANVVLTKQLCGPEMPIGTVISIAAPLALLTLALLAWAASRLRRLRHDATYW